MDNMYVIGVTGGIGTGKSTVCVFLQELGAVVLNADIIGHESYRRGTAAYNELVKAFGQDIVGQDGEIDRKKVGGIVFQNPEELKKLNAIVWPRMKTIFEEKLLEAKEQGVKIAVFEAAILFEAGWEDAVDEVWVTAAPLEKIMERLRKRNGWDDKEIARRMALQYSPEVLAERADVVVNTDCSLLELRNKIDFLWSKMNGSCAKGKIFSKRVKGFA